MELKYQHPTLLVERRSNMIALITGTSSGIGQAIATKLTNEGHMVYGISRSTSGIDSSLFHEMLLDLTDLTSLNKYIKNLTKDIQFDILINNAGCGYYGLHETLTAKQIHEMITTNFEVPILLTNLLLPQFKKTKGTIINISSVTAKQTNPHGAAYGATKAGLTNFADSIFAENRKHGVRIINIHPEMTNTNLYRNTNFEADTAEGCFLDPEDVANAILFAINNREGIVINDITLNPQLHRIKKK